MFGSRTTYDHPDLPNMDVRRLALILLASRHDFLRTKARIRSRTKKEMYTRVRDRLD